MIKKMDKFNFVIFHKDVDSFLEELSKAGLVDITRSSRAIDSDSKQKMQDIRDYNTTIGWLQKYKAVATKAIDTEKAAKQELSYADILSYTTGLIKEKKEIAGQISQLAAEAAYAEPWGSFNTGDLERISELGLTAHFYSCSPKVFKKEWNQTWPLHIISEGDQVCFTVLSQAGEEFAFPLTEVQFPKRTAGQIRTEIESLTEKQKEVDCKLYALSLRTQEFEKQRDIIKDELDVYLAGKGAEKASEDLLSVFEGFSTADSTEKVTALLDTMPVYWEKQEAVLEDNPPVALKNNAFSRLFEPIGQMYLLPHYNAEDLTPYFCIFYMLFFGLCLGDMGYGILLMICGLFAAFKLPKFASIGKLVFLLGLGSTIMPLLSGTFFGAKLYELFPMSDKAAGMFLDDMGMFWFAIAFGIAQIVFGRILNGIFTIKHEGFPNGLNHFGWAIVLVWFAFAFDTKTSGIKEMPDWSMYTLYAGLVMILLFSSNSRNIFARLGKGTFAFYDVTGFFGDILSYIRLFGLGTAGGILGLVVNSISGQLLNIPYAGWLLCAIMLLIGHTMVLFLSALGAFVHPMRLTFVEFYKNAGFDGGGRPFRPLKKEQNK